VDIPRRPEKRQFPANCYPWWADCVFRMYLSDSLVTVGDKEQNTKKSVILRQILTDALSQTLVATAC
jgi:hypothetical protein